MEVCKLKISYMAIPCQALHSKEGVTTRAYARTVKVKFLHGKCHTTKRLVNTTGLF